MGITSLVLSLAGIITFISVIGGIIFGHMSMSAAKKGQADNRGMGLAGLIIGYIFLALGILGIIAIIALVGWMNDQCASANPQNWCSDPDIVTLRDWFGG